jgi:glycosyltransferase involved in cell wall biosynthesis
VRDAQRLLVVSRDLGRLAVSDYGADTQRVRVIPNGCDATVFKRGDRVIERKAFGLSADATIVLYVGRLVPEKGLRELVAAIRELRKQRGNLRLVMVGDGPMRDELKRAAANESWLTLPGAQPPREVARWMVAADLVTLPSYSEGHPNVLVEALACGRAVVATPVGGIPEVVDETSGVLVPARDAGALARGLDEALRRDWDEAALSQRFSRGWDDVARDTLQACAEAVADTRQPSRQLFIGANRDA